MESLKVLVKACILLDWFYIDDDMFLLWIYAPRNVKDLKTVEDYLRMIGEKKEEVWLIKLYGKPKKGVFRMLEKKFKKEGIKIVKWQNNKGVIKQWDF